MDVCADPNLTNREADVAIRFVVDRKALPLNLHGLIGPQLAGGVYLSRDLLAEWRGGTMGAIRPIVINDRSAPDWTTAGEIHAAGSPFRAPDAEAQIAAVRHGIGMTRLPCFVGDADPSLSKAPGIEPRLNGALWILTQGETRTTKRVRLFIDFRVAEACRLRAAVCRPVRTARLKCGRSLA